MLPGADALAGAEMGAARHRIFLLSPANASGARARLLLNAACKAELGLRLRDGGVRLGELFSFMSALYFRGKLTYAQRFAAPPGDLPGVLVITPSRGLLPPEQVVTLADLEEMTRGQVDLEDMKYRGPLERDARLLLARMTAATEHVAEKVHGEHGSAIQGVGRSEESVELTGSAQAGMPVPPTSSTTCEVVLLGSVATPKYVEPLAAIFGPQLVFPAEFLGRGDMSRGGLLLKCTRQGAELKYVAVVAPRMGVAARPGGKNAARAKAAKSSKGDETAGNGRKKS